MRTPPLARLSPALLSISLLLAGCSADVADEEAIGASESQLTTLTAAGCASPDVTTVPKRNAQDQPIAGTARTALNGCVVGRANETGASVLSRAMTLLGNNAELALVRDQNDAKLFDRFQPTGSASGSLTASTGHQQLIDITLAADEAPKGQIRMTRKTNADGTYSLSIVNNKPFKVSVLFFSVDVIKANNLKLDIKLKAEANGIVVTGTSEVQLEQAPEQAEQASQMVRDMFAWLTDELAEP